jgi:hypothetical protein
MQKNLNKKWKGGNEMTGGQSYLDIGSIKGASFGGCKFWALIVDNYTKYCWSILLKNKSDLKDKMLTFFLEKWRIAIKKELGNMESKKVWETIKEEDVPAGRRAIKCKWIFKIKTN